MVQVRVCSLDTIPPGTLKQFYAKDAEVVIINTGSQVFCLDARCTHAGAPLEEGSVKGDVLTCPWHGSQFKISDGSVVRGPAEKTLRSYVVEVKDNSVFVEF